MVHTPESVSRAASEACVLEVSVEKPGNVTPTRQFANMSHADFVASALAIGPAMASAGERGVGDTVLAAIAATRARVCANTNLGIILLFAPLACAALTAHGQPLRNRLRAVLRVLTIDDARAAFEAIRLAHPGGLNTASEGDVNAGPPAMTLREAMQLAADRDSIASEYLTDFALTFDKTLPALRQAELNGADLNEAVVYAYLSVLAEVPDTLIARKCGPAVARDVSERAAQVLALAKQDAARYTEALAEFDAWLRRDGNRLNPGATADMIAAALFVQLLEKP